MKAILKWQRKLPARFGDKSLHSAWKKSLRIDAKAYGGSSLGQQKSHQVLTTEKDELQDEEHLKRIALPYSQYGWGYWANFWAGRCERCHHVDFPISLKSEKMPRTTGVF